MHSNMLSGFHSHALTPIVHVWTLILICLILLHTVKHPIALTLLVIRVKP